MKLAEILSDVNTLEIHAPGDMEISGICFDSRKAVQGSLFVAIDGYNSDGHKYIPSAAQNGACCALCMRPPQLDIPYVLVEDTRKAMALCAANFYGRPADRLKIVGITGTNGKTTSTGLIKTVIETVTGAKVGLIGTNGSLIGNEPVGGERTTPESLELQELFSRMVSAGCEYAVMEVSSHALYLDRVYGINFAAVSFTNLTEDHLDFHKTMEEYARCKSLLFGICDKASGNCDDEWFDTITSPYGKDVLAYSAQKKADLYAENISHGNDKVEYTAVYGGESAPVALKIPGLFSVYNSLTAIAACVQLGLDFKSVAAALKSCSGVVGRAEVVPLDKPYTVIIDYAHTPDALEKIITTMRPGCRGRLITLFGCGGDRDKAKRPIMGEIAARLSDVVIVTSDNPRTEVPGDIINDILPGVEGSSTPYVVIENRRDAIAWALDNARRDDIIILAGKGHETYQEINHVKYPFDERIIISGLLG